MVTAEQLSLTSAALRGEWWRLWTGHLVHYELRHLITNVVAVVVPLALVDRPTRRRLLLAIPIVAPALSVLLLTCARFDEYRGGSGLAMALWVSAALILARQSAPSGAAAASSADGRAAGALDLAAEAARTAARDRRTGCALLVIVAVKLASEAAGTGHLWHGVAALPLAHFGGALFGLLTAIVVTGAGPMLRTNDPERAAIGAPEASAPHAGKRRYCDGTYVGSEVVLSMTEPYAVTRPVPERT